MRQYECKCLNCGRKRQFAFTPPYPQFRETFLRHCAACDSDTVHTRVLTKKTASELRAAAHENALRQSIIDKCTEKGFQCRFLHQSVIVTTHLADWCFDYHEVRITLYHESTIKVNLKTGDYAKAHVQFREQKMKPLDVIEYIAAHDAWRAKYPI